MTPLLTQASSGIESDQYSTRRAQIEVVDVTNDFDFFSSKTCRFPQDVWSHQSEYVSPFSRGLRPHSQSRI